MSRHFLSSDSATGPVESRLLNRLNTEDLDLLAPLFEVMSAASGKVLYEPGDNVDYTYFPCGSTMASFRVIFDNGDSVETALVGREGAVGGIVSQGKLPAFSRAVVQQPGPLIRVPTSRLEEAKLKSPSVRNLFARYSDCLLCQIFQATACNAAHTLEQRAAKWLLAALDHTNGTQVPLTQEQLAGMLGVGRSYINRVMRTWKSDNILEWRRGILTINDAKALRERECGCNAAVREHFDTVLNGVYP